MPNAKPLDSYIGQKRIKDFNTIKEANTVTVRYDNDSTEDFSIRQFEAVKSSTAYDEAHVRIRKWKPLISDVLKGMLADNLQLGDKEFVLDRIDESIRNNYEEAICKVLGDVDHVNFISMKDIDIALGGESKTED